jgi:hypothetical protein
MTFSEARELLNNVSEGNEGLERFDLELRLHAHTASRFRTCQAKSVKKDSTNADLQVGLLKMTNERDGWKHRAKLGEKRSAVKGWIVWGLALLSAYLAIQQ